jgi:hypothetical protein
LACQGDLVSERSLSLENNTDTPDTRVQTLQDPQDSSHPRSEASSVIGKRLNLSHRPPGQKPASATACIYTHHNTAQERRRHRFNEQLSLCATEATTCNMCVQQDTGRARPVHLENCSRRQSKTSPLRRLHWLLAGASTELH